MTPTKCEGEPPFFLGVVQSASASCANKIVQMTVYTHADGQGPRPVPIHAAMTYRMARKLADELYEAAMRLEAAQR